MLVNRSGFESQLLGIENLGILRCYVLLLLWNFNLSLFIAFGMWCFVIPLSLYSFCSGHNTDEYSGIFLGFALFGCCVLLSALFVLLFFIRDHNTDCIFVGNCIVCLYCVLLFNKLLGPCVPFVCIVCFFICLLA